MLPPGIRLFSLEAIGCTEEIPETGRTLQENAILKARHVWDHYGMACFADDTGLLVDALEGAPGVFSARYAGEEKNATANMAKLLRELHGVTNRTARFETVIALVLGGDIQCFNGKVVGSITREPSGTGGFGYDPIFMPQGQDRSFAALSPEEKNRISHRALALRQLIHYLEKKV